MSLSAEISFIFTVNSEYLFRFIAWIKKRIPTGPIGLPSTFIDLRDEVNFIPWEMQKIDFYSIKLKERSISSTDFDEVKSSAILHIGASFVFLAGSFSLESSNATPSKLLLSDITLITEH